ncbi:hypothetical protein FRACYDRAFT_236455 [Fragilariopsis cylindrus CCMP1102]|uniref:MACPF domain-containing protein n=1 Tax=Fragilariopsis cylindrus CCMP1102 TaxID=635003 RepID=A0A1E7FJ84_9STRA|nr:hypothetical protein FRACYDRAFT_236455 [Fragilariopsis cylindrus CCMP1102]|eukprot:OEU18184.1 hypothetical protein FRACYDRAFT_236455 [Fragilariopsis cylindrus CCMP1102]
MTTSTLVPEDSFLSGKNAQQHSSCLPRPRQQKFKHAQDQITVRQKQPYRYKIMKISNLLTAISAIGLGQFGEAVDNFPHTGTSLVEKNPYPPVRKDIARSLAPGCAHMDIYTLCDVAETVTDADGFTTSTSYSKDCKASTEYFCLEEATITYDVCVNKNDIGDDIFFGIELDLSTVNQYFRFKLMLNGMEQEIDPKSYSIIPSPDGSKGLCFRYQTNVNGCKDKLDFTAGVVFFPDGKNIDIQDDQCTGNDPFVLQVRHLQDDTPEQLSRRSITLTLPEEVYSKTERLRLLEEEGVKEAALYVKQTLTRCLAFIDESNDNQSDQRNLKSSRCRDKKKKFKIKSKEKQFVSRRGKRRRFTCKKLLRLDLNLLNINNSTNICDIKLKEKKGRKVKDKCVSSCNNCPTNEPSDSPSSSPSCKNTGTPTSSPSRSPTNQPSDSPSSSPTNQPSDSPSSSPTNNPSASPTHSPTNNPTLPPLRSSDLLGCKFLFDAKNDITPFALGPLKLSTNALNAIGITGYPRNKYTPIYEDFLIPELMTNSCIEFDGSIGNIKSSIITYSNSESYSKQVAKANSISVDVSVSGSYGGFDAAASAGYAQSTKRQTSGTGFSRSAYGRRQTKKEIAKISINCLNKDSFVDLELQDLIKPEVVEDWRFIKEFTGTKEALMNTTVFLKIATGGFLQPTTYLYSATVRLSTDTLYTEKESSDSSDVSEDITASLSASYSGFGGSGSVTASVAVSNAVKEKLSSKGITSSSESVRIATGTPSITADCILGGTNTIDTPSCQSVVTDEVAKVFQDINNFIVVPSEQIGSVNLDEIVKGYFNDDIGLGETFFEAVAEKFGSITPEGIVFLTIYYNNDGCDNGDQLPDGFLLQLNTCTRIVYGPPKSVYYKVSIEGQNYRVIEANNDECIPIDPEKDEFLFPFGICNARDATLDDVFGELYTAKAPDTTSGVFSVYPSESSFAGPFSVQIKYNEFTSYLPLPPQPESDDDDDCTCLGITVSCGSCPFCISGSAPSISSVPSTDPSLCSNSDDDDCIGLGFGTGC